MQTAMVYLRTLREARGLSQADVARAAKVESKQVYRWERGESEPPASGLAAFVALVAGRAEDVQVLISDPQATIERAQALARRALGPSTEDRIQRLIEQADPAELDRAIAEVRAEIERDAGFLGVLLDLLAGRRARRSG